MYRTVWWYTWTSFQALLHTLVWLLVSLSILQILVSHTGCSLLHVVAQDLKIKCIMSINRSSRMYSNPPMKSKLSCNLLDWSAPCYNFVVWFQIVQASWKRWYRRFDTLTQPQSQATPTFSITCSTSCQFYSSQHLEVIEPLIELSEKVEVGVAGVC